jgi:hypothetical protein
MRPFLAEDPGEHVVGAAHAAGRVFRIPHGEGDGGYQQSLRRDRVGQRAVQPQILVLRFPSDAESALEITGMNPSPDAIGNRVPAGEPDDWQGAHERAHAGDLHLDRRLGAFVAEPCAGSAFLSRAVENGFGRRNRICRSWVSTGLPHIPHRCSKANLAATSAVPAAASASPQDCQSQVIHGAATEA